MTFLKKIGSIVLKVIGIAAGLMPLIKQATPAGTAAAVEDKLTSAFNAVITTEQAFTAAYGVKSGLGSDKLKAATPFVAALVQNVDILAGKKPKDEALFEDACTRATSAFADILNSYGD